ncbi:MAG: helix-turn-helix domain-containing protein, partial [Alphaproteobacteria bacterium]
MQAVRRRLARGGLEDFSFADIAADAKTAERTVYRHFPTREALLGAFWTWMQTQGPADELADGGDAPGPAKPAPEFRPMRIL